MVDRWRIYNSDVRYMAKYDMENDPCMANYMAVLRPSTIRSTVVPEGGEEDARLRCKHRVVAGGRWMILRDGGGLRSADTLTVACEAVRYVERDHRQAQFTRQDLSCNAFGTVPQSSQALFFEGQIG